MADLKINSFTTKYRDKYRIYRDNILNEYVKENRKNNQVYFVFEKNSEDENKLNATLYEYGDKKDVVLLEKNGISEGLRENDLLIIEDGIISKDEDATNVINNELEELFQNLEKEQEEEIKRLIIEDHLYKVNEIGPDRMWLFDITNPNEEEREEIEATNVSEETIKKAMPGDILVFKQGKYCFFNK